MNRKSQGRVRDIPYNPRMPVPADVVKRYRMSLAPQGKDMPVERIIELAAPLESGDGAGGSVMGESTWRNAESPGTGYRPFTVEKFFSIIENVNSKIRGAMVPSASYRTHRRPEDSGQGAEKELDTARADFETKLASLLWKNGYAAHMVHDGFPMARSILDMVDEYLQLKFDEFYARKIGGSS